MFGDRPPGRLILPFSVLKSEQKGGRSCDKKERRRRAIIPRVLYLRLSPRNKSSPSPPRRRRYLPTIDLFALSRTGPSQGIMRDAEIYLDPQISSGHDPRELLYRGSPKFFGAYFKEVPAKGKEREEEKVKETESVRGKEREDPVDRRQVHRQDGSAP